MTYPTHKPESEIGKNQDAVRRRFLRALTDLGLQRVVPATSVQVTEEGFNINGLSVGQLAQLTNVLEDALNMVDVPDQDQPVLVGGLAQPDRLPVSFTAARIAPHAVMS